MKIVAVGSTLYDLEIGCLGTLSQYAKSGHEVNLIISGSMSNLKEDKVNIGKEFYHDLGMMNIFFTKGFDYSAVTQDNVNKLRSIMGPINPSVAILPFGKTLNMKRKILAESSLLASRGVENILLYEIEKNKNFSPDVYFRTRNMISLKNTLVKAHGKSSTTAKRIEKNFKKLRQLYSHYLNTNEYIEAFESHKILLLNTVEF